MLRKSSKQLFRPFGPLRTGLGNQRTNEPFRTELTMTKQTTFPHKDSCDLRTLYHQVKKLKHTELFGLPRDLGELPRTYMLRTLFLNQPCLEPALWRLLKENDDCPFDSYDHLDMVIRVALHQNWITREKNQVDRKWYLSVHKSRSADIQKLVQAEKENSLRIESEAAAKETEANKLQAAERDEALDTAIRHLQHQITVNVAALLEQDPGLVRDLPFVRPDKAVDFAWHVEGGGEGLLARAAASTAAAATGEAA